MSTRADKDLELWKAWNRSKSSRDLDALLQSLTPLLKSQSLQYAGNIPLPIMDAEAKLQALKAFETFNPNAGVQLSTHVMNYLKKLNRTAYRHQEIYSVPEARRIKYRAFEVAKSYLSDQLDRDPNIEEMADHLKWSKAEVGRHFQEQRKELSDTEPYSTDFSLHTDPNDAMLSYAYNDLPPQDKLLLEHTIGFGGKQILSNPELMKKLNMTQGQVSYSKKLLAEKMRRILGWR